MKKIALLPILLSLSFTVCGCKFEGKNDKIVPITVYAFNDFHGAVEETNKQIGLLKLGSFIKQETAKDDTLFIDSGDSWQGSIESNYNKGEMITKVFSNANLSAMTVGNHDFDWGLDTLKANVETATYPVLSANLYTYNWQEKEEGDSRIDGCGVPYATFDLESGVKVGLIGTIGEKQIGSIESSKTNDYCFKKQTSIIKNTSDKLRTEENCDIIIASSHASFEQVQSGELTKTSSVSGKRYIDLMLNAHTHQIEDAKHNGVHFSQFGGYGENVGRITLYYNTETKELIDKSTKVDSLNKFDIEYDLDTEDQNIKDIINEYKVETNGLASQVIHSDFKGAFYSSEQLPNLMAEAIYTEANNEGFAVDFAYTNYARASFYGTTFTAKDLWRCFPFDNQINIIKVTGKTAANMLRFQNNIYKGNLSDIRYEGVYTVACIDYLANHTDENREYNYFPEREELGFLKKNDEPYIYRDVLKDFLLARQDSTFNANDYSFSNERFSREG